MIEFTTIMSVFTEKTVHQCVFLIKWDGISQIQKFSLAVRVGCILKVFIHNSLMILECFSKRIDCETHTKQPWSSIVYHV
jgi:hypothetical protein